MMKHAFSISVAFWVLLLGVRAAQIGVITNDTDDLSKRAYGGCAISPLVKSTRFVGLHNIARAQSGARPLKWDNDLASYAQCWANRCRFEHSQTRGLGENIACGSGPYTISESIDDWWQEWKLWRPGMGFGEATGHFTQMAWKDTQRVGCGVARCPAYQLGLGGTYRAGLFVVCEYYPAGNVIGRFRGEVQTPAHYVDLTRMSIPNIIAYAQGSGSYNTTHTSSNFSHTPSNTHTTNNNPPSRNFGNTANSGNSGNNGNTGTHSPNRYNGTRTPPTTQQTQNTQNTQNTQTRPVTPTQPNNNNDNGDNLDDSLQQPSNNQNPQPANADDEATGSKFRHKSKDGAGTMTTSSNGDYHGTKKGSHARIKDQDEDCAEDDPSSSVHIVVEHEETDQQDATGGDDKKRVSEKDDDDEDEDEQEKRLSDDEDEGLEERDEDEVDLQERERKRELDGIILDDRDEGEVKLDLRGETIKRSVVHAAPAKSERSLTSEDAKADATKHSRSRRWATFAMRGNHKRRLKH